MKPVAFIPLYGRDFFDAVDGHDDRVAMGYLRAIWNYWNVTKCEGLEDNSERLRKICRIDAEHWEKDREIIFDNEKFFTLGEDGKWHQKRAASEWKKAEEKYERAVRAGNIGNAVRWGHPITPPPPMPRRKNQQSRNNEQ